MDASAHRVRLLDGFSLLIAGSGERDVAADLPRRLQRLVAQVCLSGRPARTAIAGRLWPDVSERHAHGSLRSALWRLHRRCGDIVHARGAELELAPWVQVDGDAVLA